MAERTKNSRSDAKRAKPLTTNEISDMFDDIDDSDLDPDYVDSDSDKGVDSDSDKGDNIAEYLAEVSSDEDGEVGQSLVVRKDKGEIRVYMDPPVERPEADSDKDSDDSDEPSGATRHLPARLLGTTAQATKRKKGRSKPVKAGDDDAGDAASAAASGQWKRVNPGLVGTNIPIFEKPAFTEEEEQILDRARTAFDYYKIFQSDDFVSEVINQSKLYAVQKGFNKAGEMVNHDTYRCTEGLLLHSGYHSIPKRRMLWETKVDCHNGMIAEAIRRDEADAVMKCLHFNDNLLMDNDSFFKVRPIFSNLNRSSCWYVGAETYSVDETMIPYFGRNRNKQFIYGKPIRYGYKVWTLSTSDGSGMCFEPYCGRDTRINDQGLGQGPNVVLDLIEKAGLVPGSNVFFDNLFTSFPLLEQMSARQIAGTGTVRQNRLFKVPVKNKKELEAKAVQRGTMDVIYNNDVVLVGWKDNKAVYMASNKYDAIADKTCRRYNRVERKEVQVPIPTMIREYNANMGGVDLLDSMVACYRIQFRMKKWWWPCYAWSLSVSAVNAWRLRMRVTGYQEPFLSFLRELVTGMMAEHGKPPLRPVSLQVDDQVRFDEKGHWPRSTDPDPAGKPRQKNCKQCYEATKKESKTTLMCSKCKSALHALCFQRFHTRPRDK